MFSRRKYTVNTVNINFVTVKFFTYQKMLCKRKTFVNEPDQQKLVTLYRYVIIACTFVILLLLTCTYNKHCNNTYNSTSYYVS